MRLGWAVLPLAVAAHSALADCPPLKILGSADLAPTENKLAVFVPVTIEKTDKLMLLDTGAGWTTITQRAVDELKLDTRSVPINLYNVSGVYSDRAARAESFNIGGLHAGSYDFMIDPGKPLYDDASIAGVLGQNVFKHFDIDIDFGAGKLNFISQDHCEGKVIYWPATAVAVIPTHVLKDGQVIIPVTLNGKTLKAELDTGSTDTTLMQRSAEGDFNLKLGSADTPTAGVLPDRTGAYTYHHVFQTLSLEGLDIRNPDIYILPDMLRGLVSSEPHVGSMLRDPEDVDKTPDMLLGMNVLRHLHVYIAYKEQKLYVTAASAPASPASPAASTAAPPPAQSNPPAPPAPPAAANAKQ